MGLFPKRSETRSSGWSGSEQAVPEFDSEFALGYRAGVVQSIDSLRRLLVLLERDLLDWERDVLYRMRIQTLRQAINELERLL